MDDRVHPPTIASAHTGMPLPYFCCLPNGSCHVLFITTRCLTTLGSGPRSISMLYGLYLTTPMLLLPLSGALLSDQTSVYAALMANPALNRRWSSNCRALNRP